MYLTYAQYQAWNGKLDEITFERAEFIATLKIDGATHGHYKEIDPVPEVVKRLVFELVERVYRDTVSGEGYKSMTVGGMTLTYGDKKGEDDDLISMFLAGEEIDILTEPGGLSVAPAERV